METAMDNDKLNQNERDENNMTEENVRKWLVGSDDMLAAVFLHAANDYIYT